MSRSLNNDHATKAWEDAYSYKAEIAARDAERRERPIPSITITALLVWAAFWSAVVLFGSAGPELL